MQIGEPGLEPVAAQGQVDAGDVAPFLVGSGAATVVDLLVGIVFTRFRAQGNLGGG
jgi:hypothetical protein